jgi:6-pyruvoyltetrahydropterin/6-carboxytetrahydropterin synthase
MSDAFVTATKEFSWDMSHMLAEHEGLCLNVHGHTYVMHVTVYHKPPFKLEPAGPASGMIVDFKGLKEVVKELIVNPLDHAFMGWEHSPDTVEQMIIALLRKYKRKHQLVGYRPTAENMAINFLKMINAKLEELEANYEVGCVKVWETPTSFAEAVLQ